MESMPSRPMSLVVSPDSCSITIIDIVTVAITLHNGTGGVIEQCASKYSTEIWKCAMAQVLDGKLNLILVFFCCAISFSIFMSSFKLHSSLSTLLGTLGSFRIYCN